MGQSQSKFESPKKSRAKLKAPSEWRNDAEFEVVSPMSDLSNPSQFRGRQLNHTQSNRRNRTSKVYSKKKPSTGIPAPSRFYFQPVESDTNENIAPDDTKPAWLKSVQNKCTKAKNQLSDCFIQKEEIIPDHGNKVGRYDVEETKKAATLKPKKQSHNEYLQFKPIVKESHQHDLTDDVYLQHFMASSSLEESAKEPIQALTETTNSTLKGRALSLESSKITLSKGSRKQSLGTLSKESSIEPASSHDNGIFRRPAEGKDCDPIVRTQTSESMRLRASISKTESIDHNDQRRVSVGKQVQEQINQKAAKSTRVQRLRQQYQAELERLSSQTAKKGIEHDRYAISATDRSSSVPNRLSVENQVNNNNEVVEKNSEELKKETLQKEKSKKEALKSEEPSNVTRKCDDGKNRRSVSAPRGRKAGRPSIDGSALLHLAGLKAPPTKPAQPMPVLLKMAGWQGKIQTQRPSLTDHKQTAVRNLVKMKPKKDVKEVADNLTMQKENKHKDAVKKVSINMATDQKKPEKKKAEKKKAKKGRFSDPLPFAKPTDNGKSIALLLQQAYFGDIQKAQEALQVSDAGPEAKLKVSKSDSILFSPSTVASGSPKPSIFDEADANAYFLFKADENNVRILPTKPTSSCSISTLQSRSRMNVAYEAAEIPPPAASIESFNRDDRHVRFSNDSKSLSVPDIEFKYSDLTESTTGRESSAAMSIPRIDSIPEEEEEEEEDVACELANVSTPKEATMELFQSPEPTIFDEDYASKDKSPESSEVTMKVETDQEPREAHDDEETPKNPISRWSYRRDGSLTTGVTPMIDGRNQYANRVTNSPYLRFQEAKKHFNRGKEEKVLPKKKVSPVKRRSPSKRAASLVTTRVAAMEEKTGLPKRVRRATTGRKVLAPRESNMKNPSAPPTIKTKNYSASSKAERFSPSATPISSVISDTSTEDEFGRILHSNAIDEDSISEQQQSPKVSDCEESVDEFDNILNHDDSEAEDDSIAQPSVATLRARFSIESGASSITEPASVATTLQRRRLVDAMSVVSATSSLCDTASIASTAFSKAENAIPSAVQRMKANLPFRDVSSVKPNEQSQGTPMQARKWRAYAAAAREKSLSVRNLNMQ